MSSNKTDDAVSEYLREVEARLGDLPLLQRRELMADLEAHIASERSDRHVQSEGEVLEILERLGSPEVVAAAAYEEAGTASATGPLRVTTFVARRGLPKWMWAAVIAAAVVLVLGVCGVWSFSRTDVKSVPAAVPAAPAPR